MPSAPKSTAPNYPPHTVLVVLGIGEQKPEVVAIGTPTSKKSWEGVFQLLDASHNLNDSVLDMARRSYFFKPFITRLFASRSGGSHKKMIHQDRAISTIAAHRATWDQEILATGISSGHDDANYSDDVIAAGAIYAMFRMIPRDKDTIAPGPQLQWHRYYDDFPETMLWAVLHKFLTFLKRLATKKSAFGEALLEICGMKAATNDSDDEASDDKPDGRVHAGGELGDQDVPSPTATTLSNDDRRHGSCVAGQQGGTSGVPKGTATWLHSLLILLAVWFAASFVLWSIIQQGEASYCASWVCEVGRICSFPAHLSRYLGSELLKVLFRSLLRVVQWAWMLWTEKQVAEPHI